MVLTNLESIRLFAPMALTTLAGLKQAATNNTSNE